MFVFGVKSEKKEVFLKKYFKPVNVKHLHEYAINCWNTNYNTM